MGRSLKRSLCTKAVLSGIPSQELYVKVGAKSTGPIPIGQLVGVVEKAAKTGAKVVMDAVNKPRNITSKGLMDLVTEEELNRHAFTSVFSMLQLTCSDNTF
ncbi:unnamed protein product [Malus baccata var. baccata]